MACKAALAGRITHRLVRGTGRAKRLRYYALEHAPTELPALTRTAEKRSGPKPLQGPALITERTRVTICPPFVDMRFKSSLPAGYVSPLSARECRPGRRGGRMKTLLAGVTLADLLQRGPMTVMDIEVELGIARGTAQRYVAALRDAGRIKCVGTDRSDKCGSKPYLWGWHEAAAWVDNTDDVSVVLREHHYLWPLRRGVAWADEAGCIVVARPTARGVPAHWLELSRWCLLGRKQNAGSTQWAKFVRDVRRQYQNAPPSSANSDPSVGTTAPCIARATGGGPRRGCVCARRRAATVRGRLAKCRP